MPKAVVFDVDGTLVDSLLPRARAWQEALARYGRQVRLEKVLAQLGRGGDGPMPSLLTGEDFERYADELASFQRALFLEEYLSQVRPFDGAAGLLQRLRAEGRRIALATTAVPDALEHYLELLGAEPLIDAHTSDADVEDSRRNEEILAEALRLLGLERAGEALVVAGSPYAIEGAVRLGLPCLGLVGGGFSPEALRAAGASTLASTPEELLARYAETPLAQNAS